MLAAAVSEGAAAAFGADPKRVLESAVVAFSAPVTGFILSARFGEAWARGYFVFAWIMAAAMLAASTGGASSPAAALFAAPMAYALSIGGARLIMGAILGGALGYAAAAWAGRAIDPAPMGAAPELYAMSGLFLCGLLFLRLHYLARAAPSEDASLHIAEAAHELRTPLNHIIGFADMIESQVFGPVGERYREYAGLIRTSGLRLVEQITRRLDLTRIASGRYPLEIETFDARAVAADVLALSEGSAAAKRITLTKDLPERRVMLRADPAVLRQMLTNLVGNAIKFTPEDGRVALAAREHAGALIVDVTDTGPGIPAADRDRLAQPFERGANGRNAEGTGLGLALVRELAALHGGALRLGEAPGGGLLARLRLPLTGPATPD